MLRAFLELLFEARGLLIEKQLHNTISMLAFENAFYLSESEPERFQQQYETKALSVFL